MTEKAGGVAPTASTDPITVEIVRGALRAVQGEMEAVIERTAMSAFIREKKDFHAAVFDGHGRLQCGKSRPSSANLVEPIFDYYQRDSMRPGDLYWYNDCYSVRGATSHTPDQALIAPVFHGGQLVAYAQAWAHFNDIGGLRPGSISPDCTEIFHEGIIIPPVRLAEAGKINEELMRVFERNSRFPDVVRGDMRALTAAVRLGERRLEELVTRFGAERLASVFDTLIRRTSKAVRERFRAQVPNGVYRFTDTIDSDGHGNENIKLRWKLEVTPERIELDCTESDDQKRGPVNYLMSLTEPSMTFGSYMLSGTRDNIVNAGAVDLFDKIHVREGSILQPKFPAPLGQRGVTRMRNVAAYLGLLNVATRGQGSAAHSAYVIWQVRGKSPEGKPFLMSDGVAVGYGARPTADGHDAIYLVAQENYPAEFVEASYPVRVRQYAINRDTGGPGRWRGGCGVIREMEVLCDEATVGVRLDSVKNPPWGVAGGKCAGPGRCVVNPGKPDERELPPLSDGNLVKRGDVIRIETGGGGGWGHPYDREPERVLEDVLSGYVSRESAENNYGVVLVADGSTVDSQATAKRRSNRPDTKMFHRHQYYETLE